MGAMAPPRQSPVRLRYRLPGAVNRPILDRDSGCSGPVGVGKPGGPRRLARLPMDVETILRSKGSAVATIRPDETVGAAVAALVSGNIGALVASEDGEHVDGIISERDIVHALAHHGPGLLSLTVAEVMTRPVVTCDPTESVAE